MESNRLLDWYVAIRPDMNFGRYIVIHTRLKTVEISFLHEEARYPINLQLKYVKFLMLKRLRLAYKEYCLVRKAIESTEYKV